MRGFGRFSDYIPSTPSFGRSPRPDHTPAVGPDGSPATTSSPRFGGLHFNVRSMVNGSSIYSQSPVPSNNNTPKMPFLGFLRRPQSPPDNIVIPDHEEAPRDSNDSRSPLRPQHTAGSYMRTIAPLQTEHDPREPEAIYSRHPADVPIAYGGPVDPETEQLQDEVHRRRRRRHHRRRKHSRRQNSQGQWVRRKSERGSCLPFAQSQAARGKCLACLISGLFLTTVLAICSFPFQTCLLPNLF
jgi:hypothetical protein